MAFRTLEIQGPAELHVRSGQLTVEKETNITLTIPLEDISTIVCFGAGIRISTMAMAQLCNNKITMMIIDEKYRPAGILTAYEGNSRQALVMKQQIELEAKRTEMIWNQIIAQKIENQARVLSILGLDGSEEVLQYLSLIEEKGIDAAESGAARVYFQYLHPGLNRRTDDPINSCLNYGYSIIRNSLSRALMAGGFLLAFGLHHRSRFNAFNLADDLIEPFRPMVDLIACSVVRSNVILTKSQRRELAHVIYNACRIGNTKLYCLAAIDVVEEELRSCIACEKDQILLPVVLPVESLEPVTE